MLKPLVGFSSCDVESVLVAMIDLRERVDQVKGVAFVTSKLRPYRMSIDCDPQSVSPVSLSLLSVSERSGDLLALCSRSLRLVTLLPAGIAFANACGLTAQSAQVVKLRAPDATSFD